MLIGKIKKKRDFSMKKSFAHPGGHVFSITRENVFRQLPNLQERYMGG
jgi:hypothetical protein